jgi:hypothetical protein
LVGGAEEGEGPEPAIGGEGGAEVGPGATAEGPAPELGDGGVEEDRAGAEAGEEQPRGDPGDGDAERDGDDSPEHITPLAGNQALEGEGGGEGGERDDGLLREERGETRAEGDQQGAERDLGERIERHAQAG